MRLSANLDPPRALAVPASILVAWLAGSSIPAGAELLLGDEGRFAFSADFRARLEQDFDSHRSEGSAREDRFRLRARARFGLAWKAGEALTLGARLRSGSTGNHQSPHITLVDFDGNDTGDADFDFDQWFLRGEKNSRWAWIGRNSFPFWTQNELFWDADVTPVGFAGGGSWTAGAGRSDDSTARGEPRGRFELRGAYLTLPVGLREFSGNLGGVQALYRREGLTVAAGIFDFDAAREDPQTARLRNGNGLRDYRIGVVGIQRRLEAGERPLALGLDLMKNDRDYVASDVFAFANRSQTDAYAASIAWGRSQDRGDWLLALVFAHVEALAVNASYAGDDWIRWGSSSETDASDLEGFELRYARGLGHGSNLVARLYLVEAITSRQDGNRFRLDYNLKF